MRQTRRRTGLPGRPDQCQSMIDDDRGKGVHCGFCQVDDEIAGYWTEFKVPAGGKFAFVTVHGVPCCKAGVLRVPLAPRNTTLVVFWDEPCLRSSMHFFMSILLCMDVGWAGLDSVKSRLD